jgi:membrane-associated phospholipid phosphatase
MISTAAAAVLMIMLSGMRLPSFWLPAAICGGLLAVSCFWQPNLLRGLAALVAFSAAFTTLMEAAAAAGNPLADDWLLSADTALGLSAPATVALAHRHPWFLLSMKLAYFSFIPQAAILLLVLAEKPALWQFLARFMLAAQIAVCFFFFFPAEGLPTSITPGIAERFYALRAGADVDWQSAQGIITFPSCHTAWAIILVAGFWPTRLRWPAVALNAAMLVSTVTVGGHYYVDVMAGAVVAVVAIRATGKSVAPMPGRFVWQAPGRRQQPAGSSR